MCRYLNVTKGLDGVTQQDSNIILQKELEREVTEDKDVVAHEAAGMRAGA